MTFFPREVKRQISTRLSKAEKGAPGGQKCAGLLFAESNQRCRMSSYQGMSLDMPDRVRQKKTASAAVLYSQRLKANSSMAACGVAEAHALIRIVHSAR
ncbi:MAG TPA: hypothetical protein VFK81_01165 [Terriglobales bacterium]|nr:hypothetical protein [Terriglobales bacterium]